MLDNAFLFWALPLLEGTRMTAACDDRRATGALLYNLYLLYKARGNNLKLFHLISINLNLSGNAHVTESFRKNSIVMEM